MNTFRSNSAQRPKNRELPVRVEQYSPSFLYGICRIAFTVCLVTLPVDLFVASFELEIDEERRNVARMALFASVFISVVCVRKEPVLDFVTRISEVRQRLMDRLGKRSGLVFLGLIGVIGMVEVLARTNTKSMGGLLVGLLFALGGMVSAWFALKEKRRQDESTRRDPMLWLDNANVSIALVSFLPLVAARAISMVAAFDAGHREFLPYWAASALLIVALAPQHGDFLTTCRSCASWTSRALKDLGYCPLCARERFLPMDTPVMPEPLTDPSPHEVVEGNPLYPNE